MTKRQVQTSTLSGGCQCGAVRFRLTGAPGTSSVCYCRMCQKAAASPALALVSVGGASLEWTRGAPSWFHSSSAVRRGFCNQCGTPLAYDAPDGLALTVLAFDDPDCVPPVIAYGVEAKRIWCDGIPALPERKTLEDPEAVSFLKTLVSYQHPDHDTETWPPERKP
ncbi:GFA family protein [Hoeflea sp. YIM 152468]|uniref:GFA family protein n=1 Tax=Hoeflea sp. YIM 152468 TaxID=3031759 RepID=UPI0023DBDD89|nr:GFA family protein [Hoeflea sp. YIM 152468]MDF1607760.1 GFA family protein [Hoeflea sp. YIM 152468]